MVVITDEELLKEYNLSNLNMHRETPLSFEQIKELVYKWMSKINEFDYKDIFVEIGIESVFFHIKLNNRWALFIQKPYEYLPELNEYDCIFSLHDDQGDLMILDWKQIDEIVEGVKRMNKL